ncbi:MAG: ABC transporter permease [Alphaproteobacteria bacterium]|nr:ABC transporter permease [Alphaproteobacteria bacterium]MBU0806054.1 ABC transporter permease [Alphaproteobacteria bacterium]MBU0873978.1 ABC transporter permease [Alphaproteobacteria bacterium]MBU1402199.1 ABC transporter permease [Alphaproteobacteria bacterium]MBU1590844.1 ABC transporter permease [Alphaproteobacteria bacterium]
MTVSNVSVVKRLFRVREFGLLAIIALIFVVMSFASPYFLTWSNMRAVMLSFSVEGIVVIGMTILLIVGGIDLSVGSVVCFSMVVGGALFLAGLDPWTASLIAIACCGFIGFLMGQCVTRIGLHFFIVSLAFMVIVRGLCLLITKGTPQSLFSLPPAFKFIGQGSLGPVPFVIVIFVVLIAVFDVLLRRSTFFRRVYYTGSNEKAALFSGVNTNRTKVICATICGTLSGVAGVVYMARFGAATPQFGVGMELSVIAAAVIGGASLNGGAGTIAGAVLGAALLSLVTSSLILLNVPPYWQDIIRGGILLVAVTADHLLNTRKSKG